MVSSIFREQRVTGIVVFLLCGVSVFLGAMLRVQTHANTNTVEPIANGTPIL